jgi:hypothetical protein
MPVNGSVFCELLPEAPEAVVAVGAESDVVGAAAVVCPDGEVVAGVEVAGAELVVGEDAGDVLAGCVEVCEPVVDPASGSVYCWSPAEPPWASATAGADRSPSAHRHASTRRGRIDSSMASAGRRRGSAGIRGAPALCARAFVRGS